MAQARRRGWGQDREQRIVGLDVGKGWLDGYPGGRRPREASGGYERTAHGAPVAKGVPAAIVNPKRVRGFARGIGPEAKADRVDARPIARHGEVMKPAPTPAPDPKRLEKAITFLRQEEKELRRLLQERILAEPALAKAHALPTSLPGCGPVLAATLIAEMPEPGSLDRRQIAALAGPAPIARDGGLREHRRVIEGGRGRVRQARHMDAVARLTHKSSPWQARHDHLRARGKPPKLALVAPMRAIPVNLNAMMKARASWQNPSQKWPQQRLLGTRRHEECTNEFLSRHGRIRHPPCPALSRSYTRGSRIRPGLPRAAVFAPAVTTRTRAPWPPH